MNKKDLKIKRKNKKKQPREHFAHLTFNERLKIEVWDKAKVPVKEMAEMLGKDQSSIYRELHRGKYTRLKGDDYTFHDAYSPDIAEEKYRENHDKEVGYITAKSQIYSVLYRHNWRKIMPRSKHSKKASEEAIEASKKLKLK